MNTETTNIENETQALEIATPEQFAIVDAKSANWVIRRIMEAREYAQQVDEWAEAEKSRAAHAEAFFLERYGAQLEEFARTAIAEQNGRFKHEPRKSLKLPAGTIGFRAQPRPKGCPGVRVVDEQAVIEWCRRKLPAAIRITERPPRGHPAAPTSTTTSSKAANCPTAPPLMPRTSGFSSAKSKMRAALKVLWRCPQRRSEHDTRRT